MTSWKEVRLNTGYVAGATKHESWADVTKRALEVCADTGHDLWIAEDRIRDVKALAAELKLTIERVPASSQFKVKKTEAA